jgi:hypothetical protein
MQQNYLLAVMGAIANAAQPSPSPRRPLVRRGALHHVTICHGDVPVA